MGLRVLHTPCPGGRKRASSVPARSLGSRHLGVRCAAGSGYLRGGAKIVNASETKKLPPGSDGLPLLGETLSFIQDVFGFIHKRSQRYGPVFRTHILGKPTVFISGPQLAEKWLGDEHGRL